MPAPSTAHGDVFASTGGAMIVHVQRERGLAHHTYVLPSWNARLARHLVGRRGLVLLVLFLATWTFFATQAVRVPFLIRDLHQARLDATRLDTLERALAALQARYAQVQDMLRQPNPVVMPGAGTGVPRR